MLNISLSNLLTYWHITCLKALLHEGAGLFSAKLKVKCKHTQVCSLVKRNTGHAQYLDAYSLKSVLTLSQGIL